MTEFIVGLGPIGAAVGARLIERGRSVIGFELDRDRAESWARATGGAVISSLEDVDWASIEAVHIAVRLAGQVEDVFTMLRDRLRDEVAVVLLTTLAPSDAVRILSAAPRGWRVFEAPLSGGPQGALDGSMTLMLAGPQPTEPEQQRFDDMSGTQCWTARFGQPALLKLLNNTLGAYNALATAAMVDVAVGEGVDPQQFLDLVNASSGQSWMSSNFDNFHYPLLFKDAGLLIGDLGPMPSIELGDIRAHEAAVERARAVVFGPPEAG